MPEYFMWHIKIFVYISIDDGRRLTISIANDLSAKIRLVGPEYFNTLEI